MKRIVVFMQNRDFLGAQIVHIPLLKQLKIKYPDSELILFSKYSISNILLDLKLIDKLIIEDKTFLTCLLYVRLKADLTISLRKSSLFLNFCIGISNYKEKIGFESFITKVFFSTIKKFNSKIYRAINYLNLINEDLDYEKTLNTKNVIVIIPGAGGDFKIWDLNNYIQLATYLCEKYHYEIIFIFGKKEKDFLHYVEDKFTIYYDKTINEIYSLIKLSKLVIANDCGPSHFAQISNVANVILYSNEFNNANEVIYEWFNLGLNKKYIIGCREKTINSISVSQVIEKIEELRIL